MSVSGESPPVSSAGVSAGALVLRAALFGLGYLLCALAGHELSIESQHFVTFWLPGGLYLAVLLLHRTRTWPLFVAVALAGNAAFDLIQGQPLAMVGLFGFANTAEALTGAWLVRRFVAARPAFASLREVLRFVALAVVLGPIVGATIGAATVTLLFGGTSFAGTWAMWWSGDATGVLLVAPALLALAEVSWQDLVAARPRRSAEAVVTGVVAGAVAWVAIDLELHYGVGFKYLVLPFVGLAVLRFGGRGGTGLMFLVGLVYAGHAVQIQDGDVIARLSPMARTISLQLFLTVTGVTSLLLGALLTERRHRETRLRENQILLHAVVEGTSDAVFVKDRQGRYLLFNSAAARFVGKAAADVIGKDDTFLFPAEEAKAVMQADRATMAATGPRTYDERVTGGAGEPLVFLSTKGPLRDEGGEVAGLFGIARDITAGRRAEAALREGELRYRTLADSGQALIWTAGLDKKCVYFNQPWLTFTGRTLEQELGDGWTEGVHPDDLARCVAIYSTAFDRRERFSMDYRLRHHDGEFRWIQDDGTPRYDSQGEFAGYIGHCLDITGRKRAEAESEALAQAIDRKNQELESLVYVTSHDLRTPLLNIQGFSQRLQQAGADLQRFALAPEWNEEIRRAVAALSTGPIPQALGFIQASVEKMNRLLDGLLRLSRLGRAGMQWEQLDLNRLVESVRAALAHQIDEAGAVVEVETLPPCAGDATLLNQLFTNLLDNAVKYRDPARPLQVRLSGRREDGRVVYSVADNGVGIPAPHLERVWELFHRVDPAGPVAGEGLGLSLVRRIVERHRGEIRVESTAGQGTRFTITLPAAEDQGPGFK